MESKPSAKILGRSSNKSLHYRIDERGKVEWDLSGLYSEEQTTDDFDEPDGDVNYARLQNNPGLVEEARKNNYSTSHLNLLSNCGNASRFQHHSSTGSSECNQHFREHGAMTLGRGKSIRSASPASEHDQSPSRIHVRKADLSGSTRCQYSPLTPPDTPKKSPRNTVHHPGSSLLASPSQFTARSDAFSFPDDVCNESRSMSAPYQVPSSPRSTRRVVSPLLTEVYPQKSPTSFSYSRDVIDKRTSFDNTLHEEEDLRSKPLALQDPPKPKQKKTVTWDAGLSQHQRHVQMAMSSLEKLSPVHFQASSEDGGFDSCAERGVTIHGQQGQSYHPRDMLSPEQASRLSPRKRHHIIENTQNGASPPKQPHPEDGNTFENIHNNSSFRRPWMDVVSPHKEYDEFHKQVFHHTSCRDGYENKERSSDYVRDEYTMHDLMALLYSRLHKGSNSETDTSLQQTHSNSSPKSPEYTPLHRASYQQSSHSTRSPNHFPLTQRLSQGQCLSQLSPFRVPSSPSTRHTSMISSPSPKRSPASTASHFFFPPYANPNHVPLSPVSVHMPPSSPRSPQTRSIFHMPSSQNGDNLPPDFDLSAARCPPSPSSYRRISNNVNRSSDAMRHWANLANEETASKYPRSSVPPIENPWQFPSNSQKSPTDISGYSATRRRLFDSHNETIRGTNTKSSLSNRILEYLNAREQDRHIPPATHISYDNVLRNPNNEESSAGNILLNNENISEGNETDAELVAMFNEQKRMLRMRGHSMGEVEESLLTREMLSHQSYQRSHSQPVTRQHIPSSSAQLSDCDRQPSAGNIDIRIECNDVIEYNHQLADDLREMRSPTGSISCNCADVEDQILQMTRNAYNIRRLDDSPEAFVRFENEVHQTNENITAALSILRALKTLCGHNRSINDIYAGSIIISLHCRSVESLHELWSWYQTGKLLHLIQEGLVTESLKDNCNATEINLKVTIDEQDFLGCLDSFDNFEIELPNKISSDYDRMLAMDTEVNTLPRYTKDDTDIRDNENQRYPYNPSDNGFVERDVHSKKLAYRHSPNSSITLSSRTSPSPVKSYIIQHQQKPNTAQENIDTIWSRRAEVDELVSPTRKAFQELKYNP